jgi:YD repeat-containing protein
LLNRLTAVASQPSGTGVPPVSFNYAHNAANQRTQDTLADGSYWVYNYDSLGQVTSGHKYFRDNTPVPGQEFDHSFDTIGNRTRTKAGGDQSSGTGVPPVSFNYAHNAANQRTQDTLADGSYWVYNYDSLGQVTSGHKYFRDNTPVPGQEFDYSFETIGNRTQIKAGGDQSSGTGVPPVSFNYTHNAANRKDGTIEWNAINALEFDHARHLYAIKGS